MTKHGRGVITYKGAYSGHRYDDEFKDNKKSGQGCAPVLMAGGMRASSMPTPSFRLDTDINNVSFIK